MRVFTTFIALCFFVVATAQTIPWRQVDEGLMLAEITAPIPSEFGDNKILVLRIDPALYAFDLVSAKEKGERVRTAPTWAKDKQLLAVINAGMYQSDFATSVGYMQDGDFVNNKYLNADNTIVAFNRKVNTVPEFQIIDRTCQNWDTLKTQYHSFVQGIRMVDCHQKTSGAYRKRNGAWR